MTEKPHNEMTQYLPQTNSPTTIPKSRRTLRLVLGLGDTPYAKAAEAHFASMGWDVHVAKSAKDARKLAMKHKAAAAVLATDLGPESGWLSCVKLTRARPTTRVVLVGKQRTTEAVRFATFAGAHGYLAESDGVTKLVRLITGPEAMTVN